MENGQGILVSTGKIAKTTTHQSDCSLWRQNVKTAIEWNCLVKLNDKLISII